MQRSKIKQSAKMDFASEERDLKAKQNSLSAELEKISKRVLKRSAELSTVSLFSPERINLEMQEITQAGSSSSELVEEDLPEANRDEMSSASNSNSDSSKPPATKLAQLPLPKQDSPQTEMKKGRVPLQFESCYLEGMRLVFPNITTKNDVNRIYNKLTNSKIPKEFFHYNSKEKAIYINNVNPKYLQEIQDSTSLGMKWQKQEDDQVQSDDKESFEARGYFILNFKDGNRIEGIYNYLRDELKNFEKEKKSAHPIEIKFEKKHIQKKDKFRPKWLRIHWLEIHCANPEISMMFLSNLRRKFSLLFDAKFDSAMTSAGLGNKLMSYESQQNYEERDRLCESDSGEDKLSNAASSSNSGTPKVVGERQSQRIAQKSSASTLGHFKRKFAALGEGEAPEGPSKKAKIS